jgi:hypothetical protein
MTITGIIFFILFIVSIIGNPPPQRRVSVKVQRRVIGATHSRNR